MIRNEKEYKNALKRFSEEQARHRKAVEKLKKKNFSQEQIDELQAPTLSFSDQLREEITEYEKLMRGDIATYDNFTHVGKMLIALRVSQQISQRELAKRLGVSEALVSRDERNEYFGATTKKLDAVLKALDGHIQIKVIPDFKAAVC
jgi:predicted XRE-type DNA-binding protein